MRSQTDQEAIKLEILRGDLRINQGMQSTARREGHDQPQTPVYDKPRIARLIQYDTPDNTPKRRLGARRIKSNEPGTAALFVPSIPFLVPSAPQESYTGKTSFLRPNHMTTQRPVPGGGSGNGSDSVAEELSPRLDRPWGGAVRTSCYDQGKWNSMAGEGCHVC